MGEKKKSTLNNLSWIENTHTHWQKFQSKHTHKHIKYTAYLQSSAWCRFLYVHIRIRILGNHLVQHLHFQTENWGLVTLNDSAKIIHLKDKINQYFSCLSQCMFYYTLIPIPFSNIKCQWKISQSSITNHHSPY